jgi:hypothetical protein
LKKFSLKVGGFQIQNFFLKNILGSSGAFHRFLPTPRGSVRFLCRCIDTAPRKAGFYAVVLKHRHEKQVFMPLY